MKSTRNFVLFLALIIGQICYNSDLNASASQIVTADGLIQESLCTPEMIESVVSANKNIQTLSINKQTGEITNLPSIPTIINSLPSNEATKPAFHTLLEATEIALFTQELNSKYDGLNFNPEFNLRARLEQQKVIIQNKINLISKQQSFYNWAFGSSTANNLSHNHTNITIDSHATTINIPVGFLPAIAQHNNYKTYHKTKHASEAANLLFQQTFIAQQHRFPNPIALKIQGNHITSEHYIYHGFPNFYHLCNSILDLDQSQRRSRLLQIRQAVQTALFVANRKSAANIGYLIPQSAVSYLDGVVAELLRYDNHMNTLCMDSRYGATQADIAKAPEWSTFSKVAAGVVAAAVVVGVGTYAYDQYNGTNNLGDAYKATTDWFGATSKNPVVTDATKTAGDATKNFIDNANANPNTSPNANKNQNTDAHQNINQDQSSSADVNANANPNMNPNQGTNANSGVNQNAHAQAPANLHQNQNANPKPAVGETKLTKDVTVLIETLDSQEDEKESTRKAQEDAQKIETKRLADQAEIDRKKEESDKKATELAAAKLAQEKAETDRIEAERKRKEDEEARLLKEANDRASAELVEAEKEMAQQETKRKKIQDEIDKRAQQLDLQEIKRDDMEIAIRDSVEFKTGRVPESWTYRGIANTDEQARATAENEKNIALDAERTARNNLADAQRTLKQKKANELIAQGPLNKAESELIRAQRQYDIDNPPSMLRFVSALSPRPTITNEIKVLQGIVKKAAEEIIAQDVVVTGLTTIASEKIETATKAIAKSDSATRKANNSRKWADTADDVKDKIIRQNGAIRDRTREQSTNLENNRFNQLEMDRQNKLKALGVSDISAFTPNQPTEPQPTINNNQPPAAPFGPVAPSQQVAAPSVQTKTEQSAKPSRAQAALKRANKALGIDERDEILERDELEANSQALAASGRQVAAPAASANSQAPAPSAAPSQQVAVPAAEVKKSSSWLPSWASSSKEETKVAPENAAPVEQKKTEQLAAPGQQVAAPKKEDAKPEIKKSGWFGFGSSSKEETKVADENAATTEQSQKSAAPTKTENAKPETKKEIQPVIQTQPEKPETLSLLQLTLNQIVKNVTKSGEEYREEQINHEKAVARIKSSYELNNLPLFLGSSYAQTEVAAKNLRAAAEIAKKAAENLENRAEQTYIEKKQKLIDALTIDNRRNAEIVIAKGALRDEIIRNPQNSYNLFDTRTIAALKGKVAALESAAAQAFQNNRWIREAANDAHQAYNKKIALANTAREEYNEARRAASQAVYDARTFIELRRQQEKDLLKINEETTQQGLSTVNQAGQKLLQEEIALKGQASWANLKNAPSALLDLINQSANPEQTLSSKKCLK